MFLKSVVNVYFYIIQKFFLLLVLTVPDINEILLKKPIIKAKHVEMKLVSTCISTVISIRGFVFNVLIHFYLFINDFVISLHLKNPKYIFKFLIIFQGMWCFIFIRW